MKRSFPFSASALSAFFIMLLLTFSLTGCGGGGGGTPVDPDETRITGKIIDANNSSRPLAGVTVQYAGQSTVTDSNGNFSLIIPRNTPAGSATLTAPAGTVLYAFASTSEGCKNSLSVSVPEAAQGTYSFGNVIVYSNTGPPNFPCGI